MTEIHPESDALDEKFEIAGLLLGSEWEHEQLGPVEVIRAHAEHEREQGIEMGYPKVELRNMTGNGERTRMTIREFSAKVSNDELSPMDEIGRRMEHDYF